MEKDSIAEQLENALKDLSYWKEIAEMLQNDNKDK